MKTYRGWRTKSGVVVTVDDVPLDPRLDLYNHSPTGFEWGYIGSGPAQLALALLAAHLINDEEACALHQEFKQAVIATLPESGWTLTETEIDQLLRKVREEAGRSERAKNIGSMLSPKFRPGQIVATPNALQSVPNDDIQTALSRHFLGDWGKLDAEDWNSNQRALEHGGRLFSQYYSNAGVKFWIITEADRSVTTVLLPEDY